jgi:hypothetical protein
MRELSDATILALAFKRYRERYHLDDEFLVEEDPMWQNAFLEGYREAAHLNFLGTPPQHSKGGRS